MDGVFVWNAQTEVGGVRAPENSAANGGCVGECGEKGGATNLAGGDGGVGAIPIAIGV